MPARKTQAHAHVPTEATRQLVQLHSSVGTTQEDIAAILGITRRTLFKYYKRELDLARAQANATIGGMLFNKAKNGDVTSAIFWMKTRAGWRERQEVTGANGGAIQIEDVTKRDADEFTSRIIRLAQSVNPVGGTIEAESEDEG
jgi:DNA-binding XRE family transcriptional regulator